jgi:N-acetyl-gamma-glutamyl-phosphate reductase
MKALVVGGSGYTGGELLRILAAHPRIEELDATSRRLAGETISDTHPNLRGVLDGKFREYKSGREDSDFVFLALPHGKSMEYAPEILDKGIKLVDLSADYRISDKKVYERYYCKHISPELLEKAVYGLPELYREKIKDGEFIANPGCYSTAAILSIAPLKEHAKEIFTEHIVVDAKSGTSGAGANPKAELMHAQCTEGMQVYKAVGHRHQPEIEHILRNSFSDISVSFTPSLAPMSRGILSNTHIFFKKSPTDVEKTFKKFYKDEPFIRFVGEASTKSVIHSNLCDISIRVDDEKGRLVVSAAIDNLIKGAAGQAVQNMNLMMGYEEDEGLQEIPFNP